MSDCGPGGDVAVPPVALAAATAVLTCMFPQFVAGKYSYPHDEEMRHCWTSCIAAKICYASISLLFGYGFEIASATLQIAIGRNVDYANMELDILNNRTNIICAGISGWLPGGPINSVKPLIDFCNWLGGQDCESCCRDNP